MSWIDKLQETRKALAQNPELSIVFDTTNPAPEEFFISIKSKYPFVSEGYLNFLKDTDGAQIDLYLLAGSIASSILSVEHLIKRWKPNLGDGAVLPIGEDPSGSCIGLREEGRIILFDYKIDDPYEAQVIAESFDEFLDNVLMGKDFPTLFSSGRLNPEDENEWTKYLRNQGWLY